MARRSKVGADLKLRTAIKAKAIIAVLTAHAVGKTEMSATQIRAAEILLRKCLPDLSTAQLEAESGGEVLSYRIERAIVDPKP
jgi:hypothetical protein